MRIVAISDTHCQHRNIQLPEGDVLIHAGDATNSGTLAQLKDFAEWFDALDYKHKIYVPGNHDRLFEKDPQLAKSLFSSTHILHDQELILEGIKFYGSSWQPEFANWAFNLPRGQPLAEKWALIPDDVEVLITHGPPYGILDLVSRNLPAPISAGCEELAKRLPALKNLCTSIFGHLHENAGTDVQNGILFVNAAQLNDYHDIVFKPIVIDVSR